MACHYTCVCLAANIAHAAGRLLAQFTDIMLIKE